MKNDVEIVTFGCRLNSLESEVIRRRAGDAGLTGAVIVHTCAVTAEAERQALQKIRRIASGSPGATIIVAGCAAQNSAERFAALPGVRAVLGNAQKLSQRYYDKIAAAEPGAPTLVFAGADGAAQEGEWPSGPVEFEGKAKAFVQVQQGCDNFCAYCIVPKLRGRSRSVPPGTVIANCRRALASGYGEIVLTGVDIASYDAPEGGGLAGLAQAILAEFPSLGRLRLSSLDPAADYGALLDCARRDPRILPYFHLSLQSGDDATLRRMRRRHTAAGIRVLVDRIRAALGPGAGIGADLIAGFPGETEAEFANTLGLVEDCAFTRLHVFPYSARPGTPAAGMPVQVPVYVRRARAKRLRDLGERLAREFLEGQIGREVSVLVERDNTGYAQNYIQVKIGGPAIAPNTALRARITGAAPDGLALAERI